MVGLVELAVPIVVSAVFVFIASCLVHMVFKWHASDYRGLAKEAEAADAIRLSNPAPGVYNLPRCESMADMSSPAMQEKFKRGPVAMIVVAPNGPPPMGKLLGLWFVYSLLVSLFVAYLAGRTVAPGVDYLAVFRVAGTAAFLAYGLPNIVDSIWKSFPWSATVKHVFDGLLYALVTAGAFGWLWPR